MYDILSGQVRLESYGAPLVEIRRELMPIWQKMGKRLFDLLFSLVTLVILSPLIAFCAIMVRFSSSGSILYKQERIGLNGHKFFILKFRSMYKDAEATGPQLSSENDERITPWGRFMRMYRLDELPQFVNVLKGEMSIVGPRPERQFYINQIVEKAPIMFIYKKLSQVLPLGEWLNLATPKMWMK